MREEAEREAKLKRLCLACRHYDDIGEGTGLCRVLPPVIIPPGPHCPPGDWQALGCWPVVRWNDRCSHFAARETTEVCRP